VFVKLNLIAQSTPEDQAAVGLYCYATLRKCSSSGSIATKCIVTNTGLVIVLLRRIISRSA
jgi:hypothetical protein